MLEKLRFLYLYFCIYWQISANAVFFKKFFEISQTTLLDLSRKIRKLKTQNNLRNLFFP